MKNVELAGLFKRIVAAVMDGLFAVFMFFLLVTYVTTPIANKASKYQQHVMDIYQQEIASHLYLLLQQNDNGDYVTVEVKDYVTKLENNSYKRIHDIYDIAQVSTDDYIRHLNYYYTVYLTGDVSRVELPKEGSYDPIADGFVSPTYNIEIDGKLPKDIYTARYFNTTIMGLSPQGEENQSEYYAYPLKEGNPDYEGLPVVKEGVDADKVKEDIRKRVYIATKQLYESDYIASRQSEIRSIQLWTEIPVYVFVVGIVYVMFPLIFKNGETLGKLSLGVGIVSKNGYKAKKRQILFRSLVFLVEITFSLFIVGYGLTSFATLGVGCVIMMAVAVFTKSHQAPHDLAAMTVVADLKKSVFFESASEENKYEKQVNQNIENLNKYEPENPNIIQVGGTIIDERYKPKKEKKSKTEKNEK